MKNLEEFIDQPEKLSWACRRGMLELDLLLGRFIREGYATLNHKDRKIFIELLAKEDPELFDLLVGRSKAQERFIPIVELIRSYVRNLPNQ